MATSGFANRFSQHGLQIALSTATYMISSDMCVWGASVQTTKIESMSLLTMNTPRRDHNLYRTLRDGNTMVADADLSSRHVHRAFNVFRHFPCIVSNVPKPNLLHTTQIGMLDHPQKWIFHFMKTHERLNMFTARWLSVPAYHNLTPKTKSYEENSQWNGKEMKEMSRYRLGVVTQSLRGGSSTQPPIFNGAIDRTQALLEVYMYARYNSHDDATLSYIDNALCCFHNFKDDFLLGRAGKKAKAKANALRTELVKKWKVDVETNAETWTLSKERSEVNTWRDYISHGIHVSKELDADSNFLKIYLMSHWVEQIRRYGALQQYSAVRHEQAHKTNLRDGRNASNHNLNYLPQEITVQGRILFFKMRELNLQTPAQRRKNSTAACNVLHSGSDLAAPVGSQSYARPEFMGPQNRCNGKNHDAMITIFGTFLDNAEDATHHAAISHCTPEFLKH